VLTGRFSYGDASYFFLSDFYECVSQFEFDGINSSFNFIYMGVVCGFERSEFVIFTESGFSKSQFRLSAGDILMEKDNSLAFTFGK